jgi:hypothetical protein
MSETLYSVCIVVDDPDIDDIADTELIKDQLRNKARAIAGRELIEVLICGWGYAIPLAVGFIMTEAEAREYKAFVEANWEFEATLKKERKRRSKYVR